MDNTITLPAWVFIILVLFAGVMVLDRMLMPSLRWYLRRRVKKVMDEVSSRLDIAIRPFQLTRRQGLIDQLVFDDQVIEAVKTYAVENDMPKTVAQEKAKRYAHEIVPAFNAYIYFRLGYWLARNIARLIYRVRVGFYDAKELKNIPEDASVVFVMNHRSNMDYVLVSFLVAEKTALSYAIGEWARIWPLQTLLKAMGGFFVRRNSKNPLYRKVLERYVHLSTRAGVCQAVFPEGGLTKSGALLEPKLGFMDYMLREFHPEFDKDVVFVPVGINYDRVVEDRSLIRRLDPNAKRRNQWYVIKTTLAFATKMLLLSRKLRWRRFGYASVNFGRPISVKQYCEANEVKFDEADSTHRFEQVKKLADTIMGHIAAVIPILPIALISEVLLENKNIWKSELDLKSQALQKIELLRKKGAPIDISSGASEGVLNNALTMLVGRRLVDVEENLIRPKEEALVLLEYYANSIKQWK
ncbi:MAG: glycerol-3-phosphate acyltransferase [Candidatus Marinimicrobia bacterium]|jgi:glycerol-3-phosphate O-acyltransferase|nr:glycerol-3-phosphate acyltransferase [Candidatus Neomarinimicrobiota bacterium]MBT3681009.1 glycerol-3-phosphate acyltransferase [Candidatus Neomarinimicrobiota bacterium]MBT3952142.1 glycerol-3-phosphate acyltransferase [Candidatus Neomarinimicrobiota bacterium]MBT4254340.1 glycerol-3-phosphate acyltransferase [Candidatus Neomarinimicrobiota bacterium]MBT4479521.1 glycerol-3-phosphate acyltransferase [Candidatus Neomarinimicrobiota bacterium]